MKHLFFAILLAVTAVVSQRATAEVSPEVRKVGQSRLNLAAQLIEALDQNLVCDTDAYPSEINQLISSASVQLDQVVIEDWADAIPAKSIIKADFAFRQATKPVQLEGLYVSVATVREQLEGTKFHAFGMGVYGSQYKVELRKSGVAVVYTLEHLEQEPWVKWVTSNTTWEVIVVKTSVGTKATIRIGTTEFDFELKSGEIWLVPTNVPAGDVNSKTLTSTDSYCEA